MGFHLSGVDATRPSGWASRDFRVFQYPREVARGGARFVVLNVGFNRDLSDFQQRKWPAQLQAVAVAPKWAVGLFGDRRSGSGWRCAAVTRHKHSTMLSGVRREDAAEAAVNTVRVSKRCGLGIPGPRSFPDTVQAQVMAEVTEEPVKVIERFGLGIPGPRSFPDTMQPHLTELQHRVLGDRLGSWRVADCRSSAPVFG